MTAQRILVVDDDAHIRQVMRLALTKAGFDVLEASDGGEALKLLGTGSTGSEICTIMCDLQMPNVDGNQAIPYFHAQYPEIPLVILTGVPDFILTEALQEEGVCAYLQKPVSNSKLIEVIRQTARLSELRKKPAP
ncbi:MAG: response regulator [Nitrospirae bacterium]|nr:response regulator [Nitrospirota bacterium]